MAWLPICGELRSASNSVHWEPMFILYCNRSIGKNYRLGRAINSVAMEVDNVVNRRALFIEELDSLGVRHVPTKFAEFLKEIQAKDRETVANLQILVKEMELNASNKELFIQKLKGLMPSRFIWMCSVGNGLFGYGLQIRRWSVNAFEAYQLLCGYRVSHCKSELN
ncbi:hypothetical protein Tco_0710158 [Tanacetum coccineum]